MKISKTYRLDYNPLENRTKIHNQTSLIWKKDKSIMDLFIKNKDN